MNKIDQQQQSTQQQSQHHRNQSHQCSKESFVLIILRIEQNDHDVKEEKSENNKEANYKAKNNEKNHAHVLSIHVFIYISESFDFYMSLAFVASCLTI